MKQPDPIDLEPKTVRLFLLAINNLPPTAQNEFFENFRALLEILKIAQENGIAITYNAKLDQLKPKGPASPLTLH